MAEKVEYELSLRDLLSGKIDAANASVNRLEKSLGSVKNSATNLGSALGVTFGIAGVVAFTKSVITAGTTVENALTGLTTLLKDSKEAQEVIDNTMKDAQTTPFDFEVLLSANKALISADVAAKDARADVLNLANAIAATGGGNDELQRMVVNLQQIKNTGKASALDIKQFAYAGVNLYKVLEAAGQKIVKNGKEQEITYEQIAESLKKAHEAGGIYYNGLENMAGNTSVKISSLGDAFFQLSVKIFKDLKPAIEKVISAMFKFVDWLKKAWEWCVKYKDIIKSVAITLGEAWIAFKTIEKAKYIIEGLGSAFSSAANNSDKLGNSIGGVVSKVNTLIAVVSSAKVIGDWLANLRNMGSKKGEERGEALDMAAVEEKNYLDTLVTGKKIIDAKKAVGDEITKQRAEWQKYSDASLIAKDKKDYEGLYDKAQQAIVKGNTAKDFLKNLEKPVEKSLIPTGAANVAGNTASGKKKTGEKSQAVGSKAVTINVSIKDLIGTNNINVTNIKEMGSKVKEVVVSALMGAVNDFQITAGS